MLKKLLTSLLLGLTIFLSFAPSLSPAKADTTWYNQSFQEWYGKVYDPSNPSEIFGERYTAAQVQWIIYGLFSFMINNATGPQNSGLLQCFISNAADVTVCIDQLKQALTFNNTQNQTTLVAKNVSRESLLSLVFASDRPMSGISYVKQRLQRFSLVPVAHAQSVGFGFTMLEPIQGMWTAIRNISFGLFVIVAIVFAFMIMFRVKLSPQTVISVQSALPKIIVSLILVTFSYAIAGFVIDLMYVVIGFISLAFSPLAWNIAPGIIFNFLTKGQPLNINANFGVLGLALIGIIYMILFIVFFLVLLIMNLGLISSALIGAITFALITGTGIIAVILPILILIAIIILVIIIWLFIRMMWGLIKAFANVILLTIFAPLQLALGTFIPTLGFSAWLKSYVSALSVFVVTGVLLLLSIIFLFEGISVGFSSYAPDFLSGILNLFFGTAASGMFTGNAQNFSAVWPPLLGGGNAGPSLGILFLGVSLVIFTLVPKATDLVKSFIQGKPFTYGTSLGELTGPAGSLYGGYSANQITRGNPPAPLNRIPGISAQFTGSGRFASPDSRKQLAEFVQGLFRSGH